MPDSPKIVIFVLQGNSGLLVDAQLLFCFAHTKPHRGAAVGMSQLVPVGEKLRLSTP